MNHHMAREMRKLGEPFRARLAFERPHFKMGQHDVFQQRIARRVHVFVAGAFLRRAQFARVRRRRR